MRLETATMLFAAASLSLAPAIAGAKEGQPGAAKPAIQAARPARTGVLPSGLSYYLEHDVSADKISVKLIVRAGAIDSVPSERETAHILEHIVFFGGHRHDSIKDRIVRLGGQPEDANAFTGDGMTSYYFKLPARRPQSLAAALDFASEWILRRPLDDAEIARERQAVIEEGRRGASPADRERGNILRATWFGKMSPFGWQREAVGEIGVDAAAIRAFYQRHYHPANMALIVTGPIDPEAVLAAMRGKWRDWARSGKASVKRSLPPLPQPLLSSGGYIAAPIADSGGTSLQVSFRYPVQSRDRARDKAVELVADQLFADAVSNLVQVDAAAVRSGGFAKYLPNDVSLTGVEILHGDFSVAPGRLADAMAQIFTLFETVRRDGFARSDFERARAASLAAIDEPTFVVSPADKWTNAFVGEPTIEPTAIRGALASLTPAEFQSALHTRLNPSGRDIFVLAPPGTSFPDRAAVDAILAASRTAPAARLSRPAVTAPALVSLPPVPTVALLPLDRDGDVWSGRLPASGARFFYRRVEQDHVELVAKRRGGAAALPGAGAAVALASASGLGGLDRFALARYFAAEDMGVSLYAGANQEGFTARARARDFPTLLRVLRTALIAPQCSSALLAEQHTADGDGAPTVDAKLAADLALPRFVNWAIGDFTNDDPPPQGADAASLCAMHARLFGDMRDMTIAVQGPMEAGEAFKAVAQAVDLTGVSVRPSVDFAPARETGGRAHILREGVDSTANVSLVIKRRIAHSAIDAGEAAIIQALLEPRLTARLRDRELGVYGLFVWAEQVQDPDHIRIAVDFVCDPAKADRLIAAARDELGRLQREGASAAEIDAARRSVPARPLSLYDLVDRGTFGTMRSPLETPDDAAVNRWLRDYVRPDLADHFVRLPAVAAPVGDGVEQHSNRLMTPVRIKSATDSLELFVNGERLLHQGAPLFWTISEASPDIFDLGRLGVTGRSTICLRSESGDACQTLAKGEIGVFVVERDGREHVAHLHF